MPLLHPNLAMLSLHLPTFCFLGARFCLWREHQRQDGGLGSVLGRGNGLGIDVKR